MPGGGGQQVKNETDYRTVIALTANFTANVPGDYEIACAELCGLGHYRMHSMLTVMSEADFEKWLKDQEAANQ